MDQEMKRLLKKSLSIDVDGNTTFHCPEDCGQPERHIHWKKGKRVISISMADENKILMESVPLYYHNFNRVFGKEMQAALPEYGPHDISIDLIPDGKLPQAKLYPMSQDELELLREYINEMMRNGKIQPESGTIGCPVFFVQEKTGKMRFVVN